MNEFFQECKEFVAKELAYRKTIASKMPSIYWMDFTENFRYVYELSHNELLRIRYHTYHLTSDSYLTYYFASEGFKKVMEDGYKFFVEGGNLNPIDEGSRGIGVKTAYGRISHDLLRYIGVVCDVKEAGLFDHVQSKTVLEIGGGYGGLARTHLLQNPNTCYIICDLEETLFFSAVYLAIHFGSEKIHLIDSCIKNDSLKNGHVYIIPQSRINILKDISADYAISQQSLQEMTLTQVEEYSDWLSAHVNYLYSCNLDNHGSLSIEKKLIPNLKELFLEKYSHPIWIGKKPDSCNRFGDNILPRAIYKCRNADR